MTDIVESRVFDVADMNSDTTDAIWIYVQSQ